MFKSAAKKMSFVFTAFESKKTHIYLIPSIKMAPNVQQYLSQCLVAS